MPYVDQFDGLVRAQDASGRMRNVRTVAVFTDGIVICAVGVEGVWLVNRARTRLDMECQRGRR